MPAGRPPIPPERRKISARGDGLLPGGHRPGKEVVIKGNDDSELPAVPEGLGERGVSEWDKIWTAGKLWLHPAEDYHWIEMISRAYDDIAQFREEIEKTGLIVKGYAGQMTANPLLREIREAESVIRKCLSQIGFSPTDRARLGLAEVKRQTGMADLQAKINKKRSGKA
jgi:P27 family predicted phage terminase small subunit